MRKIIIITSLILFAVLGSIVFAAGSSTGNTQSAPAQQVVVSPSNDCETKQSVQARVQCRLEHGNMKKTREESCRGIANAAGCIALYERAEPCYTKAGQEKDRCFKSTAGYDKTNKDSVRNYLLYDLQEKVEDHYNQGYIDSSRASEITKGIVAAKQAILQKKKVSEIRERIAQLRELWDRDMR